MHASLQLSTYLNSLALSEKESCQAGYVRLHFLRERVDRFTEMHFNEMQNNASLSGSHTVEPIGCFGCEG